MILSLAKNVIKKCLPNQWKSKFVARIESKKQKTFLNQLQTNIIGFYENKTDSTFEEKEVLAYLKENPVILVCN